MSKTQKEIKLHLGCGSVYLPGYINIDQLEGQEKGAEKRRVDIDSNLLDLKFKKSTVNEIRLHHVFEHFHRWQVTALMFHWNLWLKKGGKLLIETPNFYKCAKNYVIYSLLGDRLKMYKTLRHVFGSKEADWASHLEGWDKRTLSDIYETYGFLITNVVESSDTLAIVKVIGFKNRSLKTQDFPRLSRKYLSGYVVNSFEIDTWMKKTTELFSKINNNTLTKIPNIKND